MMNDEFLHRFRRTPPPDFSKKLYQKIANSQGDETMITRETKRIRRVNMALGIIALCLLSILLSLASPTVRANLQEVIHRIGGFTFQEVKEAPHNDVFVSQQMSLAEAQKKTLVPVKLPRWLPAGFVLAKNVEWYSPTNITLLWNHSSTAIILGIMQKGTYDDTFVTMPGKIRELNIHRQPAALVHMASDVSGQWLPHAISLVWTEDKINYILSTSDDRVVSADDLIKIAESLP
ncbi:MAG: DUF4367 domain-containing protein [Caldilineaceae bacterium]